MVTKFVNTPSQGDLFNPFDYFGVGNDTLFLDDPHAQSGGGQNLCRAMILSLW